MSERGVSLVELLIGLVIVAIAALSTLSFFSYGLGNIQKQGNRRAAMEAARARSEELLAANVDDIRPLDGALYWLSCAGSPCTWTISNAPIAETVTVNGAAGRQMITTVQWIDDPRAGTGTTVLDILELSIRVWYSPVLTDDEYHRAHIRTLRL